MVFVEAREKALRFVVIGASLLFWGIGCIACVVPDSRPGDMLTNPDADSLLPGYVAPPPATFLQDISYGPDPRNALDLYLPATLPAKLIVFFHGGAWFFLDKSAIRQYALHQVTRGYAVASVGYRLSSKLPDGTPVNPFPAAVHDAKRAIRWLKANGATYGLETDTIVSTGVSAGGYLAAFSAATPGLFEPQNLPPELAQEDSTVAGVVDVIGPSLLAEMEALSSNGALFVSNFLGCPAPTAQTPQTCSAEALAEASVNTYITSAVPPAYFTHSGNDPLVPLPANQWALWALARNSENASWYDLVENAPAHTIDHSQMNMRAVNLFVDMIVNGSLENMIASTPLVP